MKTAVACVEVCTVLHDELIIYIIDRSISHNIILLYSTHRTHWHSLPATQEICMYVVAMIRVQTVGSFNPFLCGITFCLEINQCFLLNYPLSIGKQVQHLPH